LKRLSAGEADPEAATEEEPLPETEKPAEGSGVLRRLLVRVWHLPDRSFASQAWIVIMLILMTGAASAGVAWMMRPANPFESPPHPDEPVPPMQSAYKQYLHALSLGSNEAAWRAAIDYTPPNPIFQDAARKQLALLYLTKQRFDDANALFHELSGESDPDYRVFGLAGEAFILHRRKEHDAAQKMIEKVKPLYTKLEGPMKALFDYTLARNSEAIDRELNEEWQSLIHGPHPESGGPRDNE
jgi:hypothetical protein